MHRSSESIAALAAALAKAQGQLINPDKTQIASIENGTKQGGERSFRYAPLSAGLDIVRKTLGQHEIAIMQTTAVDQAAGMVNLTTVLAHASGEWVASDWPVCAVSETATPHRMGAALTYARRYALFTLVGIAGEDDVDALDLGPSGPKSSPQKGTNNAGQTAHAITHHELPGRRSGNGAADKIAKAASAPPLAADESGLLRDRLLAEIAALPSYDAAAIWAQVAMAQKVTLIPEDSKVVEAAFETCLSKFAESTDLETAFQNDAPGDVPDPKKTRVEESASADQNNPGIDKSTLTLGLPRRRRNRDHLRFVAQQVCLLCGRQPCDAHHLRHTQPRALSLKVSDEFAVPLCRIHHREVHRAGDEQAWWTKMRIDPLNVARKLWKQSHTEAGGERPVRERQRGPQPRPARRDGAADTVRR